MNPISTTSFNTFGFVSKKLETATFEKLKEEIKLVQESPDKQVPMNKDLAGNIEKEYKLLCDLDFLHKELKPLLDAHENEFAYGKSLKLFEKDVPYCWGDTWVNFQKKHEFNPVHDHTGVFSYVVWVDIPYLSADEKSSPISAKSNHSVAGSFVFYYTSTFGKIQSYEIPADKTYNGTIMLFPATLQHAVYPFSTSDDYRVSVSGNIMFYSGDK